MPSFTHALYRLLIAPPELAFEVIFGISTMLFHNSGLSILFLSLCMNLLLLPLYRRVDAIQDEEQELEARMEPSIAHGRKTATAKAIAVFLPCGMISDAGPGRGTRPALRGRPPRGSGVPPARHSLPLGFKSLIQ